MLVVAGALLLLSIGASSALGAPAPRADPPPSSIIWYRSNPGALPSGASLPDPLQRDLLLSAIRAGLSTGLFGDQTAAHALQALLAAAELGHTAHLAAILDFAAHRRPDGTGMVIDRLQGVVAVDDTTRIPTYLRTIRALATSTSGAEPGALEQAPLPLPGVGEGVQLTSRAWPHWMALSWTVHQGTFVVAIGRGALEAWFARPDADAIPAPWTGHRDAVAATRPDRTPFLEAYIDLAALRTAFPLAFASGRTPRLLGVLGLRKASDVMLHVATLDPAGPPEAPPHAPLIALDWTAVGGAGGAGGAAVHCRPLSASSWPGADDTGLAPPPGTSILVTPVDWPALLDWSLDLYAATVQDDDLPKFEAARARWESTNAESIAALLGSLRPYLVLSDVPPPLLPIPGLATIFVAADRSAHDAKALESLLTSVLGPFSDRLMVAGPPGARTWALKLDDRGVVRLPAWGFATTPAGPLLIGGWGLPVVHENRSRLAPAHRDPSRMPR